MVVISVVYFVGVVDGISDVVDAAVVGVGNKIVVAAVVVGRGGGGATEENNQLGH